MPTNSDFANVQLGGVPSNPQFSSDKTGDPIELLAQSQVSVEAHGDLLRAYGYNMPTATLGSHPWLRDSLADASPDEPGNAEPKSGQGVPFGGK